MEQKKECAREGNTNAQNAVKGKEYQNPSQKVYHDKSGLSIVTNKNTELKYFTGIKDRNCAWCGKNFIPTRPEYACGDCCSYTCCLRYDEQRNIPIYGKKAVVMMHPRKRTDILKFDSAVEAGEFVGIDAKNIRNACNGLSETSAGYAWRWLDERDFYIEPEPPKPEPKENVSVWIKKSTEQEHVRLANIYGVTRNRMATIIVENAIEKKEYGNVKENS